MRAAFIISALSAFLVSCNGQCATTDTALPCLDPASCALQGGTCDVGQINCCIPAAATTAATTVFGVTVTGTAVTSAPGALGPCIDNTCPPGYTCNTATQLCYTTGCIGVCIDNACPTGYTCNSATQLCCSSTSVTTSPGGCRDLIGPKGISDCPSRAFLCNSTVYYDIMTQQCPRTCNRCSSSSISSTASTNCVDMTRANGVSDCPRLAYLCNSTTYTTLMTQQCPRTCGRCNTIG